MKARDIAVLDFINREGLDNSQWGIYTSASECTFKDLFGVRSRVKCPEQFLYVWLPVEYGQKMAATLWDTNKVNFDRILTTNDSKEYILIWDLSEVS